MSRGDRRLPEDLPARIAVAIPAAGVTVLLLAAGGAVFALALCALAALAAVEAIRLLPAARPAAVAVVAGVPVVVAVAALGGLGPFAIALAAALALGGILAAARARPEWRRAVAAAALAIAWLALGLGHGVLLRELPHGGALVLDVLLGTFIGDTAAHLVGTAWGRRPLAPRISPNKTVEGALAGVVVATGVVWLTASVLQGWLGSAEALALGVAVALAAPAGDLFESHLKRRAGVKDSGEAFGAHGGVLDRIDAVIVAAIAAYYVAIGLSLG